MTAILVHSRRQRYRVSGFVLYILRKCFGGMIRSAEGLNSSGGDRIELFEGTAAQRESTVVAATQRTNLWFLSVTDFFFVKFLLQELLGFSCMGEVSYI